MHRFGTVLGRLILPGLVLVVLAGCAANGPVGGGYGSPPDLATLGPRPGRTFLKLQAYQQTTDYTCGSATLVTLLRFYGRDGDELKIADETKCSKEKGTTPQNMVAWLERQGFEVKWGEKGTLALLRENLTKGVPIIVEWIDWGGHYVTAVGYDTMGTETEDDDVIIFADPADCWDGRMDGLTCFNALRFKDMWFDAFNFDRPMHEVYIVARPKQASPPPTGPLAGILPPIRQR